MPLRCGGSLTGILFPLGRTGSARSRWTGGRCHLILPNAGVRVTAPGLVVAYSGDTGPDPALAELGRNADLYLLEATSRDQQSGVRWAPDVPQLHLSARQAGEAAAAAGAHRLMLTHFWPGNDREQSRAEAREVFRGEVLLADEGLEVPLPGLRGEGRQLGLP